VPTIIPHYITVVNLKLYHPEQSQYCEYSDEFKLTPELRHEFVTTLRSVAFLAMFGKDSRAVALSILCLKNLAILEPNLILPGLLDRTYPALETLTHVSHVIAV
jgi:proteasome activator subunit 4